MLKYKNTLFKRVSSYVFALSTLLILGCGGGGGGGAAPASTPQTLNVTVSWVANKEVKVNAIGGGYVVFYSTAPITASQVANRSVSLIDVPFVAGTANAPTSTVLPLSSGTHYFRVTAYGILGAGTFNSGPSVETTVAVPFL